MQRLIPGIRTLFARLHRDGAGATWRWLHGHVWPCLTGVPSVRFCRITARLYVGPQIGRAGKWRLQRLGVRASVNLRVEFDDAAKGVALPEHLRLNTVDGEAPALEDLTAGVTFIERVVAEGGSVYVHCQSGVGRAPTLAVAYLVSAGLGLAEALALLQRVRPFVELTPSQREQLVRFAERERSQREP